MSAKDDLTRWNRAGLERFRYIDTNAVTLLEDVRAKLAKGFPEWKTVTPEIPEPESAAERLDRIKKAYADDRKDWAYEIARSFVRATHILTEHMDAFANEGFLSTATQWEYLRRLTAMLDYRPTPPASAATTVALLAKDDATTGEVKAGLAMKFSPPEGGPALVFETLADLTIDPAMNALRLKGWQQNPDTFVPTKTPADPGWILPKKHAISAGQPAILSRAGSLEVLRVTDVTDTGLELGAPPLGTASGATAVLGTTTLLAEPDRVVAPRLNGPDTLSLGSTEGLSAGQVIGWSHAGKTGFAQISAVDAGSIRVTEIRPAGSALPGSGAEIFATKMIANTAFRAAGSNWRFPKDTPDTIVLVPMASDESLGAPVLSPTLNGPGSSTTEAGSYRTLASPPSAHDMFWFDPKNDTALTKVGTASAASVLTFDGGPGVLTSGDYLVAEGQSGHWAAVEVKTIAEREDSFVVTLTAALPANLRGAARFHGPFKQTLRPVGYNKNTTPVASTELTLDLAAAKMPDLLSAGRQVLVETDPASTAAKPLAARIKRVIGGTKRKTTSDEVRLVLDTTAKALAGFTVGDLVIRGNAVLAGHGETRPPLILGNGDAARGGQVFPLNRTDVAFVADATLNAGVRAALKVSVGGLTFQEVSTLADSAADDPHFTVHMTEDGKLTLGFGDGFNGRRLPTGRNNVSASFRQGTGSAGNAVVADSFEKPAVPHPLVDKIRQPLPATGGQDVEDVAGIRQNAPAYLRALDRAVSLADVEYLAASQPGIWHAKAFRLPIGAGRKERIELAVVPVDDVALGTLGKTIRDRLVGLAPPGIEFVVEAFDRVELPLRLVVSIDSQTHDPETVEPAVRKAVYDAFSLKRRRPGEPIYLSQIYHVVEGVQGVVYSTAHIFEDLADPLTSSSGVALRHVARGGGDAVWAAWPTGRQVIYLKSSAAIDIELTEVAI